MGGLAQDPKKALLGNVSMKRMVSDANPLTALKNAEKDLKFSLGGKPLDPIPVADDAERVMPIADDEELRKSSRRSAARRARTSGRGSTLLYAGNGLGG